MLAPEFIRRKRDGEALPPDAIRAFVAAIADGSLPDAQIAAFAMASLFRGLSADEAVAFTLAMRDSGKVLRWDAARLGGPVADKHSTGGVGDAVSLVLAPAAAACGVFVPMIAGRGLAHTGGTIDKLEAIPGYQVAPGIGRFQEVVAAVGCAIVGQTSELAPADGRLYAVRDVTATVEQNGLITASILSKKLAAGVSSLVMDIKVGNGAFMRSEETARALATSLREVGAGAGLPVRTLLTPMDEPLADAAGNALEVAEAVALLRGEVRSPALLEVTLRLGEELLVGAGLERDPDAARARLVGVLKSGAAAERFARMVAALGGPADFVDRPAHYLAAAPVVFDVWPAAAHTGKILARLDTRMLGLAVVELGGGRRRLGDRVDPAVGIDRWMRVGMPVDPARPLARIHARDFTSAARAADAVRAACTFGA